MQKANEKTERGSNARPVRHLNQTQLARRWASTVALPFFDLKFYIGSGVTVARRRA